MRILSARQLYLQAISAAVGYYGLPEGPVLLARSTFKLKSHHRWNPYLSQT